MHFKSTTFNPISILFFKISSDSWPTQTGAQKVGDSNFNPVSVETGLKFSTVVTVDQPKLEPRRLKIQILIQFRQNWRKIFYSSHSWPIQTAAYIFF